MEPIDINVYVDTAIGLQHTTLSKIPKEKGKSLLLLDTIGNIFGWLFAKVNDSETEKIQNGFSLTGNFKNNRITL